MPPGKIDLTRHPADLPALTAAFLLVVVYTFSDDIVEFLCDVTGNSRYPGGPWLVFALDCLLVVGTAALKWWIAGRPRTGFIRPLLTGWWALGATLVVGGHLALLATADHRGRLGDVGTVWLNLLATLVFVTAMAILLFSALSEHTGSRGWLVPVVAGTFVAQFASTLWYPVIEVPDGCAGEISSSYFSNMGQIIPVILLTLGVESAFVSRTSRLRDPGRRVAPVLTVVLLVVAELLTFTMLVKADKGPQCGIGAIWHEYIAFVVTAQALTIGLLTMLWLLLTDAVGAQ